MPIELDVQFTADDGLMVFHDESLERLTGVKRDIRECTRDDLRCLKILDSDYHIPRLDEVLDFVGGQVPLLIELKNKKRVGQLERKLASILKNYKGNYALQSFNPASMGWFAREAPHILRGQLSCSFEKDTMPAYKKFMLKNLMFNFISKPDFISYDIHSLPQWIITRMKKHGKVIIGWTARNRDEYEIALQYCDNIIFEGFLPSRYQ
jgi:glycerophosphoryl diester phosphodiesterase